MVSIEYSAFTGCSSLTSIVIPDGITIIEDYTFEGCTSLQTIVIPASVTNIKLEGSVFINCNSLAAININENNAEYSSDDGVLYNKSFSNLLYCPRGKSGDLSIHENTVTINKESLLRCVELLSVTVPATVTTIEDQAFYSCSKLTSAHFKGDAPVNVGSEIFRNCDPSFAIYYDSGTTGWTNNWNGYTVKLSETNNVTYTDASFFKYTVNDNKVTITGMNDGYPLDIYIPPTIDGKPVTAIGDSAFDAQTDSNFTNIIKITIPDGVTSIGNIAFGSCSRLTEFAIPDSVETIGYSAFTHCYNLGSIDIPDSVTSIGYAAFDSCYALTSVNLSENLTVIEDYTFGSCTGLTSIYIPASVTTIKNVAFSSCSNLKSAYFIGDAPVTFSDNAFSSCHGEFKIYYKADMNNWTDPWNGYDTEVY